MSFNYTLALTAVLSAEDALNLLGHQPNFNPPAGHSVVGPGLVVDIRPADQEDKEFALEHEGFEPDLSVYMSRKRGNEDDLLEVDNVIRTTMILLHHCTGNAVLRANDALWVRLRDNTLLINSKGAFWRELQGLLPLVTLPYHAVPLPDD